MSTPVKPAEAVRTAPVVAAGLLGGYITARESGIRPLGGVVLGAGELEQGFLDAGPGVLHWEWMFARLMMSAGRAYLATRAGRISARHPTSPAPAGRAA